MESFNGLYKLGICSSCWFNKNVYFQKMEMRLRHILMSAEFFSRLCLFDDQVRVRPHTAYGVLLLPTHMQWQHVMKRMKRQTFSSAVHFSWSTFQFLSSVPKNYVSLQMQSCHIGEFYASFWVWYSWNEKAGKRRKHFELEHRNQLFLIRRSE